MEELIAITQKALQSQSWKMKAQGAAAMASLAKQTGSLVPPHLGMVLSALLQGLSGRTWTGKVKTSLLYSGLLGEKCLFQWRKCDKTFVFFKYVCVCFEHCFEHIKQESILIFYGQHSPYSGCYVMKCHISVLVLDKNYLKPVFFN